MHLLVFDLVVICLFIMFIFREWKKELQKTHPSLAMALCRVYGLYYAFLGIFATCEVGLVFFLVKKNHSEKP